MRVRPRVFVGVDEAAWLRCRRCLLQAVGKRAGGGYPRAIRDRGGRRLVRPWLGRCRGCRVAHVLLPAHVAPRRADSASVILGALLAKAGWHGHRSIANERCLPAGHGARLAASRDGEPRAADVCRGDAPSGRARPAARPGRPGREPVGRRAPGTGNRCCCCPAASRAELGSPTAVAMVIGKSPLHPLRT